MSLWKQAFVLLASSLAIELVFTALLWRDLSSLTEALTAKAHAVSTRVTIDRLRDHVEAFQFGMFATCLSRQSLPPAYLIADVYWEEAFHSGDRSNGSRVMIADAEEIDERLAENVYLIAQLASQSSGQYVPSINTFLKEIDKLGQVRKDIHLSIAKAKVKLDIAMHRLNAAFRWMQQNDKARAAKVAREGFIALKVSARELRDLGRVEKERQWRESRRPGSFNTEFVDSITNRLIALIGIGAALSVSTAAILTVLFRQTSRTRLLRLMDNMNRLSANQALQPLMEGRDEFASIDKTLSQMAGAISLARKKERAIVENSAEMICSIDESGKFLVATAASEKVLAYPENELHDLNCMDILADSDKDRWVTYFEKTKSKAEDNKLDASNLATPENSIECWVKRKDGAQICAQWSLNWLESDRTGICVIRDVTERKRLEKAKQEFVAMVSQDLREPIAAMQRFLDDTCESRYGELSADGIKQAQSAKRSNNRLLSLVDDLLNIDNMSLGKMDLNKSICSSTQIVNQSFVAVKALASRSGIKLESRGEDISLLADSDRLVQVLVNFIGNAIKFSPRDSTITCVVAIDGANVEFLVIDQGRGIPAHMVDSVFERFKQVTKTDASEKGGAGLGLAICKSIIESHDGLIGARSEEGKGSTFWFKVPHGQTL